MSKELKAFLQLIYSFCKQYISYYEREVKYAGVLMPYLVTHDLLRNIADRDPFIDDGDCGDSVCFYCRQNILEESKHSEDCVYVEACKIIGED